MQKIGKKINKNWFKVIQFNWFGCIYGNDWRQHINNVNLISFYEKKQKGPPDGFFNKGM